MISHPSSLIIGLTMQTEYDPQRIETEAQQFWQHNQSFRAVEDPTRPKFYCLSMFPYPSGRLHMGHVRNYTIGDTIARYQRMLGKNVLQPMGWDAFGLPAENAAIQHGIPPSRWTRDNIAYMKRQLQQLGFSYDWQRELATCDPDYYRWEQWLFTQLMARDLVYRATTLVNWDPVDQTVLANEQVIDGKGWRSGAPIEKREIQQWSIRITAYAQELLDGLDQLPGWPDRVLAMQRHWIGRSEGVAIRFPLAPPHDGFLDIYTTRPDTVMGVTYLAVAAEHPLTHACAEQDPNLVQFIESCRVGGCSEAELETMEKRGYPLPIHAHHPITGEALPVYAANFVLMSYGSGAVMAVPAHDQRDWDFAQRYGLPKKQVVFATADSTPDIDQGAYTESGILAHSGPFDGLTSDAAGQVIADWLQARDLGGRQVQYRLRDWGVSRQRYWGCPIPVIRTAQNEIQPAPDLPVRLPEQVQVDGTGSPLTTMPDFFDLGAGATRETDTFDTFVESSWYYARYCCNDCDTAMLDERANYWLPVDQYVGGIEHAVLHLLYARFFHKVLRDVGLVHSDEPFTRLLTQGMVVAETWYREDHQGRRQWFNPSDVTVQRDDKGQLLSATLTADGQPVFFGGIEKMSKSKNNGVDPELLISRYGADTVRLYIIFTAPPEQSLEWSEEGVEGAFRFLKRLWTLAIQHHDLICAAATIELTITDPAILDARRSMYEFVQKALFDYERQQFNTVVSSCMTIINGLYRLELTKPEAQQLLREGLSIVLRLLAPITPHITHHLWRSLQLGSDIGHAPWPVVDEAALIREQLNYVVQVNGKVRDHIIVDATADQSIIEATALASTAVQRHVQGQTVVRVIVVPKKLINLVVRPSKT
jgi:leucyl-tRNA synthetase